MVKLVSWNINGLRTQKDLKQLLDQFEADIICIQETKITRDMLQEHLAIIDGYYSFFSFSRKRSGYSGVVTYCRKDCTPQFAKEGIAGYLPGSLSVNNDKDLLELWDLNQLKCLDAEGRTVITQHAFLDGDRNERFLFVINVYCPRADPDKAERKLFKLSFYNLLRHRVSLLSSVGDVVIVGDINTSHQPIDHCDPHDIEDFYEREDRKFVNEFILKKHIMDKECLECLENNKVVKKTNVKDSTVQCGLKDDKDANIRVIDSFRYFHPHLREQFTCWNTKANARATNYGTRIDYCLCSQGLLGYLDDADIHAEVFGSDHCPVSLRLKGIDLIASKNPPEICTKFFPEFQGSQQKLLNYFKPTSKISENNNLNKNSEVDNLNENSKPNREINNICIEKNSKSSIAKRKFEDDSSSRNIKLKQQHLNSYFFKNKNTNTHCDKDSEVIYKNSDLNSSDAHLSVCKNNLSTVETNLSILRSSTCEEFSNVTLPKKNNEKKSLADHFPNFKSSLNENVKSTSSTSTSLWGFIMKGPPPAPNCSGHGETTVLRIVKKKGPNYNKQFYVCARGVGKIGDPQAQCNFFKWL